MPAIRIGLLSNKQAILTQKNKVSMAYAYLRGTHQRMAGIEDGLYFCAMFYAQEDSNLRPSDPQSDTLSS